MGKPPVQKTPEQRKARRDAVLDFMETLGPYSVPAKVLAKKHDCSVQVIYGDIKFLINKIDIKRMDLEGKKLMMSLSKNLAITETLKNTGTADERIRAVRASNNTAEVLTKIMENYGFKEKIADNLNVMGDIPVTFNIIEKSVEEIKRAKLDRNKSNSKSKAD